MLSMSTCGTDDGTRQPCVLAGHHFRSRSKALEASSVMAAVCRPCELPALASGCTEVAATNPTGMEDEHNGLTSKIPNLNTTVRIQSWSCLFLRHEKSLGFGEVFVSPCQANDSRWPFCCE